MAVALGQVLGSRGARRQVPAHPQGGHPRPCPGDRAVLRLPGPMRRIDGQVLQLRARYQPKRIQNTSRKGPNSMAEIEAEEPDTGSRRLRKPTGLGPKGSKFWGQIADEYALEDTPEVALILEQACRTLDIVERLQRIVDEAPSLQVNGSRGQPAPLPELTELRQYRAQLAALIKQLNLEDDEPEVIDRDMPMTRSESGRAAAAARWGRQRGA